ncbi:branched-chain amino acid ABC transporter permease [Photobacterium jeanii]|uniref:Branched-chain amino acid ABC transporter permease n=1 Tax=Photobacterium jeanii TaxID=858640 RepID=A0A178KKU5_9GAMM|nr:AzlC family ABC transporter permease [Photobacterium jeanii]OAN17850.1 branched-chain amino acid ABC transporter permease [Photobacterium jeanii]
MEQNDDHSADRKTPFWQGVLAVLPLSIAVIPWGILAGSYAIDAGLTGIEAQAMSAVLFAGSAQLVASGMFKAGVGIGTLLLTTFFITSRHFLYSVSMRDKISHLPFRWRLVLGFWLTDELFAVCGGQTSKEFNRWFALGAGGSFYLIWNLASFVGIVAGSQFPALNEVGLDFAVAATFIALVIPQIKSVPIVVSVIVSLMVSVVLTLVEVEGALMTASLCGMASGYLSELLLEKARSSQRATASTARGSTETEHSKGE